METIKKVDNGEWLIDNVGTRNGSAEDCEPV